MRRLRIAQVAPPVERVPPAAYGGTERVVDELTRQLVDRGHAVTVFASGDSDVAGRLVPTVERALRPAGIERDASGWFATTVKMVVEQAADFDVIHSHLEWWSIPLARLSPVPAVATFHGRLDLPWADRLLNDAPDGMVAISRHQASTHPNVPWTIIHNGLKLDRAPFSEQPGDAFCFVGRVDAEKGITEAIEIALRAGRRLRIAAKVGNLPRQRDYFETVFRPALQRAGRSVEFLGELQPAERDRLFVESYATLMPGAWPEPFGLVSIESLACGTPVLARRVGALPEIIREGVDGFFGDDAVAMAFFADRLGALDRREIRERVIERFSAARMADRYEELYAQMIAVAGRTPSMRERAPDAAEVAEALAVQLPVQVTEPADAELPEKRNGAAAHEPAMHEPAMHEPVMQELAELEPAVQEPMPAEAMIDATLEPIEAAAEVMEPPEAPEEPIAAVSESAELVEVSLDGEDEPAEILDDETAAAFESAALESFEATAPPADGTPEPVEAVAEGGEPAPAEPTAVMPEAFAELEIPQPVEAFVEPEVAEPVEAIVEQVEAIAEPEQPAAVEAIAEPEEPVPVEAAAEPEAPEAVEAFAELELPQPVDATAEAVEAATEPVEAAAEPEKPAAVEAIAEPDVAEPVEAIAEPVEAIAEPAVPAAFEAIAEPEVHEAVDAFAELELPQPVEATGEPVEAIAEPDETETAAAVAFEAAMVEMVLAEAPEPVAAAEAVEMPLETAGLAGEPEAGPESIAAVDETEAEPSPEAATEATHPEPSRAPVAVGPGPGTPEPEAAPAAAAPPRPAAQPSAKRPLRSISIFTRTWSSGSRKKAAGARRRDGS